VFAACGIMHRSCKLQTQSSAPEGGRNYSPKNVKVIEIIIKTIIFTSSWLFIFIT